MAEEGGGGYSNKRSQKEKSLPSKEKKTILVKGAAHKTEDEGGVEKSETGREGKGLKKG